MTPRKRLKFVFAIPISISAILLFARGFYWWRTLPTPQSVCQESFLSAARPDSAQACFAWSKEIRQAIRISPQKHRPLSSQRWYGTIANQWRNVFHPIQSGVLRHGFIRQLDTAVLATTIMNKYSDPVASHMFISLYLHPIPEDICRKMIGHDCDVTSPEEATLVALWIRSPSRLLHSDTPLDLLQETTRSYFPQVGGARSPSAFTLKFAKVDVAGEKIDIPILRSTLKASTQLQK